MRVEKSGNAQWTMRAAKKEAGNGSSILEVSAMSKRFGGLAAIERVSFKIDQGSVVGLIGPNGAGKTTLFNLITGFLRPDSGTIYFEGKRISNFYPYQTVSVGISRTFQLPKIFYNMSVIENVMVGGFKRFHDVSENRHKALGLLEFVNLSKYANGDATSLTIAGRKKLEVCRALATCPKLLLLDELIAGLNTKEVSDMTELIMRISGMDINLILIEHVMKFIMSISQRIIVLHHGQKIADGEPLSIVKDKKVIDAYLGKRR